MGFSWRLFVNLISYEKLNEISGMQCQLAAWRGQRFTAHPHTFTRRSHKCKKKNIKDATENIKKHSPRLCDMIYKESNI